MKKDHIIYLVFTLLGVLLFIPFTGRLHLFDWDEINFAEAAREMIETGDYLTVQIFYQPFWEKPPIFIWLQAISMKLFGVNEFGARFPNALCGIITLIILFHFGKQIKDRKFGIFWASAYLCSFLPFFYFKSGIIDPWFNLFIFLAVFLWVKAMNELTPSFKFRPMIWAGVFLGLAVLTKGPVALLVFGLTIAILVLVNRFKFKLRYTHILAFTGVFLITGSSWFIVEIAMGEKQTVIDFIDYQIRLFKEKDAGHGGFPLYHFVILLFGVFPASIFAIHGHKKYTVDNDSFLQWRRAMVILFWVVLILFSIVNTKIVHYSSLCYFPMTFLAAYAVHNIWLRLAHLKNRFFILLTVVGIIPAIAVIALPFFDKNKQWFIDNDIITHPFTVGNLEADPRWSLWISLIGAILLAGIIVAIVFFKKGKIKLAFISLSSGSLVFILSAMLFVTPGIEKYSQNAAIVFFEEKGKEDAYINTFYKSYAMLFYSNAKKPANLNVFNAHYLATKEIDKKAYFVARIDKKHQIIERYPKLELLFEKNGYTFWVRYPDIKTEETELND